MTGTPTSESGFAGQQGLTDDASEFNTQVFLVQSMLGRVRTAIPVVVMEVTNAGEVSAVGTVDVKPLVNQVDGLGKSTPHATIFGVPYCRLQGGSNAIIIDPKVGDVGLMGVCDRDVSAVKSTKEAANPGSKRRFDLADGVYIGGMLNGAPTQYVRFTSDDKLEIISTAEVMIRAPIVVVDGDLRVTGLATAKYGTGAAVGLTTHNHTQPNDGHGDIEQPTAAPTAGT